MPERKIVQVRRGTSIQHSTFAGAEGELTVDTDKHTVVVHDGHTIGGFPLKVEAVEYSRPRYLTFRAAIVQQGIPSLGFSSPENAPEAIVIPEASGIITGAARFLSSTAQAIQDHFMLPEDWVPPLELDIVWVTSATFGTVSWNVETYSLPFGTLLRQGEFSAPTSVESILFGAPGTLASSTLTIPSDTFTPNSEVFFRLSRNYDTVIDPVDLISLRFTVRVLSK